MINRRQILIGTITAPVLSIPRFSQAQFFEAALVASLFSGAVQGVISYMTEKSRQEASARLALAQYKHEMQTKIINGSGDAIEMDVALTMTRQYALTLGLSSDIDGGGTLFGIQDGQLAFYRRAADGREVGGSTHPGEAEKLPAAYKNYGSFPVPTESSRRMDLTTPESKKIRDKMEIAGINSNNAALYSTRRFTVDDPYARPNLEMATYVDKTKAKPGVKPELHTVWI